MANSKPPQKLSYNIVLVGKTGNGKSATGNTILNRKVFRELRSTESVTVDCQLESVQLGNIILNVIDTPGIMDTSKTFDEIRIKLEEAMSLCPAGFHAFIFVLQSNARYTKEEIETLKQITRFFGPTFMKICIVALTHGESFEMDDIPIDFKDWLRAQEGGMKKLIEECENRCILFYNSRKYASFDQKRLESVGSLLHFIQHQKMLYTDKHFKEAEKERSTLIVESRLPQLEAKYQTHLSLITDEIEKCSKTLECTTFVEINSIQEEINKLLAIIEMDDKGTTILQKFKQRVRELAQATQTLKSSKNKSEKLKKMAQYTHLLKNPPSKFNVAAPILKMAATAVGGVIGTAVTTFVPPVAVAVAGTAATGFVANAVELGYKIKDIKDYKSNLETLEREIKALD